MSQLHNIEQKIWLVVARSSQTLAGLRYDMITLEIMHLKRTSEYQPTHMLQQNVTKTLKFSKFYFLIRVIFYDTFSSSSYVGYVCVIG